jgi:hypothetical protein
MPTRRLHALGLRGSHFQAASLAKTADRDERGNADRRALFMGLWPPMFWLIGDPVDRHG